MTKPKTRTGIYQAGDYDLEPVVALLTVAFMNNPLGQWLIPDAHHRANILPDYFRIFVEHALRDRRGIIELSPHADAVAVWFSLQADTPLTIPHYDEQLVRAVGGSHLGRFHILDRVRRTHHRGDTGHDYLALFAVHPDRQGHGLGTALLRPRLHLLDARRQSAYVETTDPRSATWLQRHGYHPQPPYQPDPDSPRLLPMWRPPQQSDRSCH